MSKEKKKRVNIRLIKHEAAKKEQRVQSGTYKYKKSVFALFTSVREERSHVDAHNS